MWSKARLLSLRAAVYLWSVFFSHVVSHTGEGGMTL
jgi:hypothetical protein